MAEDKKLDLGISVPEEMIKTLIMTAVAKSLGNADSIVESIVRSALEAKDMSNYGRTTLFQAEFEKIVRNRAMEAMKEWLAQNDAQLKAAFMKALTRSHSKVLAEIVDRMVAGLGNINVTSVGMDIR